MRASEIIREGLASMILNKTLPAMKNILVKPELDKAASILTGRLPKSANEITYAYRNMSEAELAAAKESGYFLPNPDATVANGWDTMNKYWSAGDIEGVFGRLWNKGTRTVRVPVDKFTPNSPIPFNVVEVVK